VLTRRNADLLVRNGLTLAVLVGSPALVITMMAVLFRPGAFDDTATSGCSRCCVPSTGCRRPAATSTPHCS
jgi:hypothetical protein